MHRIIMILLALTICCGGALAQGYPARQVTLVVPAAPGGPTDVLARVLSDRMRDRFGQPFVVENRGGANGAIGVGSVARAAPDGYSLLISVDGPITVIPAISKNLAYDSLKDLRPVAIVGDGGDVALAVPADSPAKSVKELVELMRSNPAKANYVSSGAGFPSHIVAELLKREAKFDVQHIAAKGAGAAITELLSGRMSFSFPPVSLAQVHAKAGKIRVLAVAAAKRNRLIPDVPTFAELGFPGVTPPGYWIAIYVPAATPSSIVDALALEIRRIAGSGEFNPLLERQGLVASAETPDAIVARMRKELGFWATMVRELGIQAE